MPLPYGVPMTEQEDLMRNLLDKGEYTFTVKSIELKRNKANTCDQLEVDLTVFNHEGNPRNVRDWITFDEMWRWKMRHFAATCGLLDKYEQGTLEASDFLGKHGVVKLIIKDYEKDGVMTKVNNVADYIKPGHASPANDAKAANHDDFMNSEIPF